MEAHFTGLGPSTSRAWRAGSSISDIPGFPGIRRIQTSQRQSSHRSHLSGRLLTATLSTALLIAKAREAQRHVACAAKERKEAWRRRKNSKLYQELEEGIGSSQPRRRKPEVLSPAGGWPQLRAAVRAGADAVYFGLDVGLNARARAANFSTQELPEVMKFLHSHGVKAYVTLNTLVFDHELFDSPSDLMRAGSGSAIEALRLVAEAKVDALIVQDIGLALVCRELCPEISVHASTQMSITSAPGALFAERLGADRVVLGRELSIKEIASVAADVDDLEVEVFVHGALCVSYSGQCFSSEAWGGRSANRGQCAQACRLPYGLVKDGELIDLGDAVRYLLSPQDLMALDYVPALIDAGVGCFKIEGRLKGEEYVALTTAAYRQAIDQAWDATTTAWEETPAAELLAQPQTARTALAQLFARGQDEKYDGLSPGFLEGPQHQRLVRGVAPKHRGVLVGTVCAVQSATASFALKLASGAVNVPLRPGAGIFFDQSVELGEDAEVLGGKIGKLRKPGGGAVQSSAGFQGGDMLLVRLDFGSRKDRCKRMEEVSVGDLVWRNKDDVLEEQVRELSLVNQSIFEQLPDRDLANESLEELQPGHPATLARLEHMIGGSHLMSDMPLPEPIVPRLTVLCRTPEQAEAVLQLPPGMVYELQLDFLEAQGLHESVQRARAAKQRVAVCLPRVLKPNEDRLWQFYQRLEADAMLVRSCGALHQLLGSTNDCEPKTDAELIGDFSLNVANAVTAAYFLDIGLDRLTPSHDLSALQICQLAKRLGPERAGKLEVVAHQHLPIFHTEHCVFCRFLSNGNDYTDCGHPCERHNLHLRDSNGKDHKVLADMGCRNTVFNAKAQSAAMDLAAFASAQVGFLRLELVDEVPDAVGTLVRRYHSAASGRLPADKLWNYVASLGDSNGRRQGVERGSLDDGMWRERDVTEMKVPAASQAGR